MDVNRQGETFGGSSLLNRTRNSGSSWYVPKEHGLAAELPLTIERSDVEAWRIVWASRCQHVEKLNGRLDNGETTERCGRQPSHYKSDTFNAHTMQPIHDREP